MLIKNLLIVVGIASIMQPAMVLAQDFQRTAPPDAKPPLATTPVSHLTAVDPPAAEETVIEPHLNGILVLGSTNKFNPDEGVSGVTNVVVDGPEFLRQHQDKVAKALAPYLGKPLNLTALTNLQIDLVLVCRQLDRPMVDVFFAPQTIKDGTVQIMVFEGKMDHAAVIRQGHTGKEWWLYSDRFLTNKIHLKAGDSISQSQLLQDVTALNLNPQFREVTLAYEPGAWDQNGHGTTTVDLQVQERFPLRVFTGYDNYGLKILGENQLFAGFNYGNLFGLDQQLNYEYITDTYFDRLQSHSGSYIIPLPWGLWGKDSFTFFGNYNFVKPNLTEVGISKAVSFYDGRDYQISARYTIALPHWFDINQDIALGFDFKSANTPDAFGYADIAKLLINRYRADIDQFVVDYHAYKKDSWGYSQFSGSGYYSPGGLLGKNTDSDFATFGPPLHADYYYGRIDAKRDIAPPFLWGTHLLGRAGWEDASTGLLPSEELYIGGNQILRGYPENIESGDQGWYASAELHAPLIPMGNLTGQQFIPNIPPPGFPKYYSDTLDVFGFFDYGSVSPVEPNKGPNPNPSQQNEGVILDSAGAGLVYTVSQYLKVNFAYGFQLRSLPASPITPESLTKEKSRFHLSVTASF
jgi:hemolysin activation/secretion protein